jgi:hypothetical protein
MKFHLRNILRVTRYSINRKIKFHWFLNCFDFCRIRNRITNVYCQDLKGYCWINTYLRYLSCRSTLLLFAFEFIYLDNKIFIIYYILNLHTLFIFTHFKWNIILINWNFWEVNIKMSWLFKSNLVIILVVLLNIVEGSQIKSYSCYDNIDGSDSPSLCTIGTVACAKVVYFDGTLQKFCARKCNAGTYSDGSVYYCSNNLCNNSKRSQEKIFLPLALNLVIILTKFFCWFF